MGLSAENIINILKKILGGEIVQTKLGKGLSVSPREAFLFSAVAGGAYFENDVFPFTPKGLLKVFYNANSYNFVTGLFDNLSLRNTPYYLTQGRPYLSEGQKVLVPIEILSEAELRKTLNSAYGPGASDKNIIIIRVDISKKGHGLEPFLEYLTCKFFNKLGYITENQVPLSHALGTPDFGGYGIVEIQEMIYYTGILPKGFNILELSMLRIFPTKGGEKINSVNDFIVGEAKTSTTIMNQQLAKYVASGFFDRAFEIHPSKNESTDDKFGLLSLRNDELEVKYPKNNLTLADTKKKLAYKAWLESYLNCYLISNYTNDELNLLSKEKLNSNIHSEEILLKLITQVNFNEHLHTYLEFIKNGTFK